MIWQAISATRDLGRLHGIASILIRYGFGDLVRRVGLSGVLERAGHALHWRQAEELARLEPAARVRRTLEDLGPTFVKLGQILATRVDMFPADWIAELGKLQDHAPALPFEELRAQLTEDLGAPPESVFQRIETEPLAAASLAQVHRAWLTDGTPVILKIRRPNIRPVVEADLRLLSRLAEIIETEAPEWQRYRPKDIVRQFTQSLHRELDFAVEGRNAERVAANFKDEQDLFIPKVYWDWTCERLNVQDCVDGIPGRDMVALENAGLDRRLLARRGTQALLKMILEDGFYHADPHPGNVYYLPNNRIALIDFGMTGRLSQDRRFELARLLHGIVTQDSGRVAEILQDWSGGELIDESSLTDDIDVFIDQYQGISLKQIRLGTLLSDLTAILRAHGLLLPSDLALLIKALITLEGYGRQLDPDFDLVGETSPYLQHVLTAQNTPKAQFRRGWRSLVQAMELAIALPKDVRQLLRAARYGKLQLQIELVPLKQFTERLDRAVSRLSLSIVIAALIIGSAIVLSTQNGDAQSGIHTIGLIGFIAACTGAVWLLISIWRSGKS